MGRDARNVRVELGARNKSLEVNSIAAIYPWSWKGLLTERLNIKRIKINFSGLSPKVS